MLLTVSAGFTQYSVDWFKIAGGGGTSTGGVYAVSGTIGQPDAGTLNGTNAGGSIYTVQGGFWGILAAVQTPGAPLLAVTRTAANSVVVSWPAPSDGWQLQENPSAGTTNWTNVATAPLLVGERMQVALAAPSGNRFYRLRKP